MMIKSACIGEDRTIDGVVKVLKVETMYVPKTLIVDSADLVTALIGGLGPEVCERDVWDIINHIVQVLSFEEDNSDVERMSNVTPNFHGMRSTAFFKNADNWMNAKQACLVFATGLYDRFRQLGVYNSGELHYMYGRLLDNHIVLDLIPH